MAHVRAGILAVAVLFGLCATARAQKPDQDEMKKKLAEKLAEPWVTKTPWITNFAKAKDAAKKAGKPILGYFTRSYAY